MRIFVAGPLTHMDPEKRGDNVEHALDTGHALLLGGHQPFVPHLSQYWDDHLWCGGDNLPYERWMEWTLSWLRVCDALYFIGSSPGADRELALAEELGLPIYRSLDEVPAVEGQS